MEYGMRWLYQTTLILGVLFVKTDASSWNYISGDANGKLDQNTCMSPENWSSSTAACGGSSQSPVDITDTVYDPGIADLVYTGYSAVPTQNYYELVNNGHSVVVNIQPNDNNSSSEIFISAGGLPTTYQLVQFHFHWGSVDSQGSEHEVEGEAYSAELHFVHMKSSYSALADALGDPEGLAVLGVFIEVDDHDDEEHPTFANLTSYLSDVVYNGNQTTIPEFALDSLLPEDQQSFYRYEGSLTTPTCDQAVIWTVFKDSIEISETQMASFRAVLDDSGAALMDNFRPTQAINSRTIHRTFSATCRAQAMAGVVFIMALIGLLI